MADNVSVVAGAATYTASSDEAASGQVQRVKLCLSANGSDTHVDADANGLEIQGAGTAGTATGGVVTVQGVASMTPILATVTNAGTFAVQNTAATVASVDHRVSAASDNAANIKASAGTLYAVSVFNVADYPVYVKFHNTAGTPTSGAGVVLTLGVQAGWSRDFLIPQGRAFATGIGISIVKGIADNSTTAVAAADCVVDVVYA